MPGWIDTFQGITGLLSGLGLGIVRVFPVRTDCYIEIMPSDYSVNCIISSAWGTYKGYGYSEFVV